MCEYVSVRERERERERERLSSMVIPLCFEIHVVVVPWPNLLASAAKLSKSLYHGVHDCPNSMVHSNKKLLFFISARQTIRLDLRVTSVELCTTQLKFSLLLLLLLLLCFCHASIDSMWVQKEREGARERERIKERQKSV